MSTIEKARMNPEDISPSQVGDAITNAWRKFINRESKPRYNQANVYATGFRECTRQMVLDMTHGETLPLFDADTLARFRRGNDRERDMMSDLEKIGRDCEPAFDVVGRQERFELRDKKGRVVITGKIDGRLMFKDYKRLKFLQGQRSAPIEAKAWNANLVAQIDSYEDLFKSRWTKSGAYQILAYIFSENTPLGFFLLDRAGLPALIPVELYPHLDKMERFLEKAEIAMNHKEAGTLPDFIQDREECKFCPHFGRNCNPPMSFGEGAQVFTDPEVIQKAERFVELEKKLSDEEWTELNQLDKWKGEQFRGVETGLVGALLITGKWKKKKEVTIPEDKHAEVNAKKIELENLLAPFTANNPKGQFSVKLIRVADVPAAVARPVEPPKEKKKQKKKGVSDEAGRQGSLS